MLILLLAYLSYLIRLQFQLIRPINSLNYCNTILNICPDFNSYFHIPFHSNPKVQIQTNRLCHGLVHSWSLASHDSQHTKFKISVCPENTYWCFLFLRKIFQDKLKCVLLICHLTLWLIQCSKSHSLCFFAILTFYLFK